MKLAIKVYIATLLILTLAFAASAQNNGSAKSENDPRNTAPTVGTGGPLGGPTGLFTVYDGSTLRKGEYTLSIAISNYDRDPGNADFTVIPASFQIGLNDHVELFFGTDAYRGVKVNSPRNLSSFYLPNSQFVLGGVLTRPPAIIMAPRGPGVPQFQGAVFRPTGAPWAVFPYSGANAGTFGLLPPFYSGPVFGFPAGTNALLGPPVATTGNGADNFPGIGSVYGSILPGVVLQSVSLLNQAGAPAGEGPSVFTLAPTYLADAPFINRRYGESAFNSFDVGVKWRLTGLQNPVGFGFIAAYTWYTDHATDASGFNQLQRGSSGGGNRGDIFAALFADVRVAKWANISANLGYKYTSATKGDFPGGTFTLLDRPDELQSSFAVDFPVNKFFQPIAEFRSLYYMGGRTPNAFENHPMEGILGARIFPVRWAGIGLAYRHHFNQQDVDSFDEEQAFTGSITIPCSPGTTAWQPVTIINNFRGIPPGFVASSDPHGFIGQLWIGRRNKRVGDIVNIPAVVNSVTLSDTVISLPCPPGYKSSSGACNDSRTINVSTSASDAENDVLTYNYTVSGGRIVGQGANVQWDLSGVQPGTYTITTGVDDGCGVCGKTDTKTITIEECKDCVKICECPTITITGPGGTTNPGETMNFTLSGLGSYTVNWSVSAGTIESGQGTASITVRAPADGSVSNITATAEVGGLDPNCNCTATYSETGPVAPPEEAKLIDEFGALKDDDVKARVDNFYIQLNNNPSSQGYIIIYGTPAEIKRRRAQIMKAINRPGTSYDASRVTIVESPSDGGLNTKFYLVPPGAANPNP